jgi:hypothetical protein
METLENVVEKRKLGLGQFYVDDVVISPLNQEELADGWRLVLPKSNPSNKQHMFTVQLSQLPEHLWRHVNTNRTYKSERVNSNDEKESETYYMPISDGIYTYNVKVSEHDHLLFELFNLIASRNPNIEQIRTAIENLEQFRVKGWLMIRARRFL